MKFNDIDVVDKPFVRHLLSSFISWHVMFMKDIILADMIHKYFTRINQAVIFTSKRIKSQHEAGKTCSRKAAELLNGTHCRS